MISPHAHDANNHDTTGDDSTLPRYYPLEGLLPPGHCIAVYPPSLHGDSLVILVIVEREGDTSSLSAGRNATGTD